MSKPPELSLRLSIVVLALQLLCKSAKHDRVSLQQLRQQAATYREQLATAAREKAVLQQNVKHLEVGALSVYVQHQLLCQAFKHDAFTSCHFIWRVYTPRQCDICH